ncbi:hypothetical protein LIER_03931 [Lithospermum erythrorhizon]|uniref:Uncharacterized protein n=1 Tax=Lithospermum erythrorhizon TaxID=34254 RepID=A0AAV3NW79_LITER
MENGGSPKASCLTWTPISSDYTKHYFAGPRELPRVKIGKPPLGDGLDGASQQTCFTRMRLRSLATSHRQTCFTRMPLFGLNTPELPPVSSIP